MSTKRRFSTTPPKNVLPSQELLDDLCSRFVLNVPEEELESFERILFLVEYAYWFYEDNLVEKNPSLKSFSGKEFARLIFNRCEVLKPYAVHINEIFKNFTSYKLRVPVNGTIILDESYERCLLVKGWKGHTWSFPRGKRNKLEDDHDCAVREVLEEIGFDISNLLNKDEYIEKTFGRQRVRLYIIPGVKNDTSFIPQTKKEISEIAWHRFDELESENYLEMSRGGPGPRLYMIAPFLKPLKSWISAHPALIAEGSDVPVKGTLVWSAKTSPSGGQMMTTGVESESTESPLEASASASASASDLGPGMTFRNFSFDTPAILKAMEAAFGA